MSEPRETEDDEIERDARLSRSYSLADAIGREGAGLMKGASVVSQHQHSGTATRVTPIDARKSARRALASERAELEAAD